jgi:RNA polymerase sigma factor (sigma-70 family)
MSEPASPPANRLPAETIGSHTQRTACIYSILGPPQCGRVRRELCRRGQPHDRRHRVVEREERLLLAVCKELARTETIEAVLRANGGPPSSGTGSTTDGLARVLRDYGGILRRIASAWTRTPSEREDLEQEMAFAIWKAMSSFRGESSERAFVLRIAQNRAIAHARKRRPEPSDHDEEPESCMPSPEVACANEERRLKLWAAVGRLSDAQRQVITLALEGLSPAEIAEVAGISENNAAVRLSRARQELKKCMNQGDER